MSTVWTSASMSLTAVHSYVPALCLLIDGISRYSSSDAMSPTKGHTHTKQKKSGDGHFGVHKQRPHFWPLCSFEAQHCRCKASVRSRGGGGGGVIHLPTRMFALKMQRAQRQWIYFQHWQKNKDGSAAQGWRGFRSLLNLPRQPHTAEKQRNVLCVNCTMRSPDPVCGAHPVTCTLTARTHKDLSFSSLSPPPPPSPQSPPHLISSYMPKLWHPAL